MAHDWQLVGDPRTWVEPTERNSAELRKILDIVPEAAKEAVTANFVTKWRETLVELTRQYDAWKDAQARRSDSPEPPPAAETAADKKRLAFPSLVGQRQGALAKMLVFWIPEKIKEAMILGSYFQSGHLLLRNQELERDRLKKGPRKNVVAKHENGAMYIENDDTPRTLGPDARLTWDEFVEIGSEHVRFLHQYARPGNVKEELWVRHWADFYSNIQQHRYTRMNGGKTFLIEYASEVRMRASAMLHNQNIAVNIDEVEEDLLKEVVERRGVESQAEREWRQARILSWCRSSALADLMSLLFPLLTLVRNACMHRIILRTLHSRTSYGSVTHRDTDTIPPTR
jgi:hypothetical protein